MIKRIIEPSIHSALQRSPAVVLLGPRQVGKTTIALQLASSIPSMDIWGKKVSSSPLFFANLLFHVWGVLPFQLFSLLYRKEVPIKLFGTSLSLLIGLNKRPRNPLKNFLLTLLRIIHQIIRSKIRTVRIHTPFQWQYFNGFEIKWSTFCLNGNQTTY